MNTRSSYILFLIFILSFSCKKKDYPESIVLNEPQFYARLQFEEQDLYLTAGRDNYRLFSSYTQDNSGLYNLISELKTEKCTSNCPNSLRVEILDSKLSSAGAATDIDNALRPGPYQYASSGWKVSFESSFNKSAGSYFWSFGDGSSSTLKDPVHVYKEGGVYSVCLKIVSSGGCENSICNTIEVGYPPDNCDATIQAFSTGLTSLRFNANPSGQAPFTYFWDFGDGDTSNLAQPDHFYSIGGAYPVTLTIKDAKKDVSVRRYNAVTYNDPSSCTSNFKIKEMIRESGTAVFSRVSVRFTDINGRVYHSGEYTQENGSSFEILSVENYENNENGEPTKKLKVRFNAILYNGTSKLVLKPSEAVMCVSYKK